MDSAVSHNDLSRFEQVLEQKFKNVDDRISGVHEKLDIIIQNNLRYDDYEKRISDLEKKIDNRPTIYQLLAACAASAAIAIAFFELIIN